MQGIKQRSTHYFQNRNLENIKGEKWKEVNGFEEYYQVSDFGRIKANPRYREIEITEKRVIRYWTKELILKQSKKKFLNIHLGEYNYCLTTSLFKDGVYAGLSVPRLVYTHFTKDKQMLTRDMLILHKDNDSLHNHISNLYAADFTAMQQNAYKRDRKKSYFTGLAKRKRKQFVNKAVMATSKPVTQYSLEGIRLQCYKSTAEAAVQTHTKKSSISNALAGRYLTAGGFIWRYGKGKAKINVKEFQQRMMQLLQNRRKPVVQFDTNLKKLAEFPSMKIAAASVNGSARQLSDAINGRSKTAYGYKWKEKS